MKNTKRDIELLFEIGCLRFIPRSWKRFFNPDVANNSEHIFRVTWIAWILSKYENVKNEERVMKMALMHDLSESRTGDVDYISRQYVERKEFKAISDIVKDTVFEEEMMEIWNEYEERKTIEAKIVKDADNLDVELELMEQEVQGHTLGRIWNEKRKELVYPKLYTKSAREFWDKIHESKINDWHLNANNRFSEGDWKKQQKQ